VISEINCAECDKCLFFTDKISKSAGKEEIRDIFIFKIPVFYNVLGCFFFCNKYSKENISFENKLEGDKSISVLKAKVHSLVKPTSKTISRFQNLLKSIREK